MGGRRSKTESRGKRYPLNMRTTKELRDQLERAAVDSGRSLAQEVEFRIGRSFDRNATVLEAFGTGENSELIKTLFFLLGSPKIHSKIRGRKAEQMRAGLYLASVTAVLAYAEKTLDELVSDADPLTWLGTCMIAIGNLNGSGASDAIDSAMRAIPEMNENPDALEIANNLRKWASSKSQDS
jgi:hypothetical protein